MTQQEFAVKINKTFAKKAYKLYSTQQWSKSDIERELLGDTKSNGKRITKIWLDQLNVDTRRQHPLVTRVAYLEALLDQNNIKY